MYNHCEKSVSYFCENICMYIYIYIKVTYCDSHDEFNDNVYIDILNDNVIILVRYNHCEKSVRYFYVCVCVCLYVCIYIYIYVYIYTYIYIHTHRVEQEECAKLREGVPYVKLYRKNPKHLVYPKLNGLGDNGQRRWKLWQLLHTYCVPNSY
jgi:hypothetical protein